MRKMSLKEIVIIKKLKFYFYIPVITFDPDWEAGRYKTVHDTVTSLKTLSTNEINLIHLCKRFLGRSRYKTSAQVSVFKLYRVGEVNSVLTIFVRFIFNIPFTIANLHLPTNFYTVYYALVQSHGFGS